MVEDEQQLGQRARDLASRLDALDLYDVAGRKVLFADLEDFRADLRRVYNVKD
jgi:hypothetical protein